MSQKIKRFYKGVEVVRVDHSFRVELDGRPTKSPGRKLLLLPNQQLAEGLAQEWRQQGEFIDPAGMPIMRFAGQVHDAILEQPETTRAEILKYAGSDLLCYRAEEPSPLVGRQATLWDPVLETFAQVEKIRFKVSSGISWVDQDAADMERFAELLKPYDGYALGALLELTVLSGSAALALALARGWLSPTELWELCHLDEDFQAEQWGRDEEAEQVRERRHKAFTAVLPAFAPVPR